MTRREGFFSLGETEAVQVNIGRNRTPRGPSCFVRLLAYDGVQLGPDEAREIARVLDVFADVVENELKAEARRLAEAPREGDAGANQEEGST